MTFLWNYVYWFSRIYLFYNCSQSNYSVYIYMSTILSMRRFFGRCNILFFRYWSRLITFTNFITFYQLKSMSSVAAGVTQQTTFLATGFIGTVCFFAQKRSGLKSGICSIFLFPARQRMLLGNMIIRSCYYWHVKEAFSFYILGRDLPQTASYAHLYCFTGIHMYVYVVHIDRAFLCLLFVLLLFVNNPPFSTCCYQLPGADYCRNLN